MTGLELIFPAIIPALVDGFKNLAGGLSRKIGGLSVEDQVKIQAADVEKLKALAALDTVSGNPSQWVVDLRASFRYVAAGICIGAGVGIIMYIPSLTEVGMQLVSAPFAFIFGERMYMNLKSGGK